MFSCLFPEGVKVARGIGAATKGEGLQPSTSHKHSLQCHLVPKSFPVFLITPEFNLQIPQTLLRVFDPNSSGMRKFPSSAGGFSNSAAKRSIFWRCGEHTMLAPYLFSPKLYLPFYISRHFLMNNRTSSPDLETQILRVCYWPGSPFVAEVKCGSHII